MKYNFQGDVMRVMAVDYGDARTGVAFSDRLGLMAGEAFVIEEKQTKRLVQRLVAEAAARETEHIVVGYPKNMNGTLGPRALQSEELSRALARETGLPVSLWDERLTTVDAARILHTAGRHGKKNRHKVDAVAAALILEGFLPTLRRREPTLPEE